MKSEKVVGTCKTKRAEWITAPCAKGFCWH